MSRLANHPAYLTIAALLRLLRRGRQIRAVPAARLVAGRDGRSDARLGPDPCRDDGGGRCLHAGAGWFSDRRLAQRALLVIAWIGTITAVLAALMATQQDDIKRILAYSTLSQLGYMVMAVGLASGAAAMFHLFTHAFFKALLFLGAGSIIYMLHHEQNIWKMGGLAKRLPITFLTFLVGTLALIGFPGFSGFFSKDAILALAFQRSLPIFVLGAFTALLTAFYMTRLLIVALFGRPRSQVAAQSGESPLVMTVPLMLLAIPAAIGGFSFFAARFLTLPNEKEKLLTVPIVAFVCLLIGILGAVLLYRNRSEEPLRISLFRERFYLDEFYAWLIRWTQDLLASLAGFVDRWILDGAIVRGLSGGTWSGGFLLRLLQVGNLQAYGFLFGLGVVGLLYFTIFH